MADGPNYDNSGNLFKNKKKGDNEKAPDYEGACTIGGQAFRMAAWIREGAQGKYMRVKFSYKDPNAVSGGSAKNIPPGDEDIPF